VPVVFDCSAGRLIHVAQSSRPVQAPFQQGTRQVAPLCSNADQQFGVEARGRYSTFDLCIPRGNAVTPLPRDGAKGVD
jgi:hypothetical protein